MASIDDLLNSPLESSVAPQDADFLVRKNQNGFGYDWKPVSDRAKDWAGRSYPSAWITANEPHRDGWLVAFSTDAGVGGARGLDYVKLRINNYIFVEEV